LSEPTVHQRLIGVGGDPFFAAAPALAEMTPSARERLVREHYAVEYRQDLRRIVALGVTDEEEEG
jgi:hypothetical protein